MSFLNWDYYGRASRIMCESKKHTTWKIEEIIAFMEQWELTTRSVKQKLKSNKN